MANPSYAAARTASEKHHLEFLRTKGTYARTGITLIPVVVHVVYNTAAENISDAQINSQIDVLNLDYRMKNADIGNIPAVFNSQAADARIEFVLASTDPMGNPTTGITRTQTNVTTFTYDDKVKHASTGGADAWATDRYLNLWVCSLGGGLLGYAQFSGGPADTDGVVITYTGFGTSGTAAVPFNLGRTASHEIGHFLNLHHLWGDQASNPTCTLSDQVGDTPTQSGPNYGKPSFPHVTCSNGPNGDLFMDYMDYVDDDSMFMFTVGQVARMQACLDNERKSLGTTKPEKKFEPEIKKHEPDIKKFEPDIKKHEPDIKKHEPDIKKFEPDIKKHEPDIKKHEPDIKKFEPDIKKQEPDIKKIEPDIKKGEIETGKLDVETIQPTLPSDPMEQRLARLEAALAQLSYFMQAQRGTQTQAALPVDPMEQRLARLEAALAQLSHFIQAEQRPQLERAPLRYEAEKPKR
jgi:hypothetical protein